MQMLSSWVGVMRAALMKSGDHKMNFAVPEIDVFGGLAALGFLLPMAMLLWTTINIRGVT